MSSLGKRSATGEAQETDAQETADESTVSIDHQPIFLRKV